VFRREVTCVVAWFALGGLTVPVCSLPPWPCTFAWGVRRVDEIVGTGPLLRFRLLGFVVRVVDAPSGLVVVLLVGCNPVFAGSFELLPDGCKELSRFPWLVAEPTGLSPCPPGRVGEG
jgi:hypothetical protein